MFKFLNRMLEAWGKSIDKRTDTYEPQYDGRWKNKGSHKHENWVWVEETGRKCVVNVFQLDTDYVITVGQRARGNAIESVECRDNSELDIALELLSVYYGTLGNVVMNRKVE
jgi:hypothetical protein